MGIFPTLAIFSDSESSDLDSEAFSIISSDPNEDPMLSPSGSEELDVGKHLGVSAEQLPQSATFEDLLVVVTRAVTKVVSTMSNPE